jgi:hypothetical protein
LTTFHRRRLPHCRLDILATAISGAGAALDEIKRIADSGDSDDASFANALLILNRNEEADLKAIRAIVKNTSVDLLKPISDDDLQNLTVLEKMIDARMKANNLIKVGLSIASEVLRSSETISQILDQNG